MEDVRVIVIVGIILSFISSFEQSYNSTPFHGTWYIRVQQHGNRYISMIYAKHWATVNDMFIVNFILTTTFIFTEIIYRIVQFWFCGSSKTVAIYTTLFQRINTRFNMSIVSTIVTVL